MVEAGTTKKRMKRMTESELKKWIKSLLLDELYDLMEKVEHAIDIRLDEISDADE